MLFRSILAGGYYLYTFNQASKADLQTQTATTTRLENNNKNLHPGYVPPTKNPPNVESSDSIETKAVSGNSDVGMEFPTLDNATPTAN